MENTMSKFGQTSIKKDLPVGRSWVFNLFDLLFTKLQVFLSFFLFGLSLIQELHQKMPEKIYWLILQRTQIGAPLLW